MIRLQDFEGLWRLDRRIEDRRASLEGRFSGEARWTGDGAGLRQSEAGVLHYGTAAPMRAERTYLWSETSGQILVRFADGREFHGFDPGQMTPKADHLCGEDFYRVAYDLSAWPEWSSQWHVTGPRKDLTITSRFTPDQ